MNRLRELNSKSATMATWSPLNYFRDEVDKHIERERERSKCGFALWDLNEYVVIHLKCEPPNFYNPIALSHNKI